MTERIGFIGLGNIGKPIAKNIARGDYEMSVYDIAGTTERPQRGRMYLHQLLKLLSAQALFFFVYLAFPQSRQLSRRSVKQM